MLLLSIRLIRCDVAENITACIGLFSPTNVGQTDLSIGPGIAGLISKNYNENSTSCIEYGGQCAWDADNPTGWANRAAGSYP